MLLCTISFSGFLCIITLYAVCFSHNLHTAKFPKALIGIKNCKTYIFVIAQRTKIQICFITTLLRHLLRHHRTIHFPFRFDPIRSITPESFTGFVIFSVIHQTTASAPASDAVAESLHLHLLQSFFLFRHQVHITYCNSLTVHNYEKYSVFCSLICSLYRLL